MSISIPLLNKDNQSSFIKNSKDKRDELSTYAREENNMDLIKTIYDVFISDITREELIIQHLEDLKKRIPKERLLPHIPKEDKRLGQCLVWVYYKNKDFMGKTLTEYWSFINGIRHTQEDIWGKKTFEWMCCGSKLEIHPPHGCHIKKDGYMLL